MTKNDLANKAVSLMKERDDLNKQVKKLRLENKKLTKQLILSGVEQRSELLNDKKCDKFNEEVEQLKNDLGSSGNW